MKNRVVLSLVILLFVVVLGACRSARDPGVTIDPQTTMTTTASPGSSGDLPADSGNQTIIRDKDLQSGDLSGSGSALQPVFFQYDRYDIREDQMPVLQQNARILLSSESGNLVIQGHCDERGTEEYNLALGDRRARAVREYLVGMGVSADRMRTISFGESKPFAEGHTEEAWSENRRAQFVEKN